MQLPFSTLQTRHWNPGTTKPLILPITVICNTSEELLFENIRINSRRPGRWMPLVPAHDQIAVVCGSGPSLNDCIEEIRGHQKRGADIFALNGSAAHLASLGIMPDYQVLLDAQKGTADLIGPAKEHLFAAQVDPSCFDRIPEAQLWHIRLEGLNDHLPPYEGDYCLIGGSASVGNTSTCLAYAMGYRHLELYGYDSCHRGDDSHAFHQAMNDDDPGCHVVFNGKEYYSSLTMKLQAEKFMEIGRALEIAGCTIILNGSGLLPDMWRAPIEVLTEQEKYERMWSFEAYRFEAPGEHCVDDFLKLIDARGTLIDFGCGTGRASLKLKDAGFNVILVDFAANCRDYLAQMLPFFQSDLSDQIPIEGNYGYCTDVMEHIQPEKVDAVIQNIMKAVPASFFQISTRPDSAGAIINQVLHLTVRPHEWWKDTFHRLGFSVTYDAHDSEAQASQFFVIRQEK